MPNVTSTKPRDTRPQARRIGAQSVGALSLLVLSALVACTGEAAVDPEASSLPSGDPEMAAMETEGPMSADEMGVDLCASVETVDQQLASLRAVELRLPNRVALDIELGKLQAAFGQLRQADLGRLEEQLETPLKRLGYRLGELELAVEDFRTNPRPRRAAPHVEGDSGILDDELAAFSILARCSRT